MDKIVEVMVLVEDEDVGDGDDETSLEHLGLESLDDEHSSCVASDASRILLHFVSLVGVVVENSKAVVVVLACSSCPSLNCRGTFSIFYFYLILIFILSLFFLLFDDLLLISPSYLYIKKSHRLIREREVVY